VQEKDLLLEIGMEELPISLISDIFQEWETKFAQGFRESRIDYQELKLVGTPRRMTVYLRGVAERQSPVLKEIKGPAKKVGVSEAGEFLEPAHAFARSQGIGLSDIVVKETERGVYLFGVKKEEGRPVEEILPTLLPRIISSLEFPRSMLWGEGEFRFIRPIRWVCALWGDREIAFEIAGIKSSRFTRGHRFLSPEPVELQEASQYFTSLLKAKVVVNQEERRKKIEESLSREEKLVGGHWLKDESLIQEVNFLVEYPDAITGRFDLQYLRLPHRVLTTVMKHHQKYFACVDDRGELLPFFFIVLNRPREGGEKIVKGNERVLKARLEDALFFFEEDRKKPLRDRVEALSGIIFQESLGTMKEKVERLEKLACYLGEELGFDSGRIKRAEEAAHLSKVDLACEMVKELPELQGYMGRVYALLDGEEEEVAIALEEQYYPLPGEENYPGTIAGTILSLVDKMDNIVSSFSLGRVPSGSQDPWGLRRMAQGIVNIILHCQWYLSLSPWVERNIFLLEKQGLGKGNGKVKTEVVEFLFNRLRLRLLSSGFNYSVINAVLSTSVDDLYEAFKKIETLEKLRRERRSFLSEIVTGFTRANNISKNFSGNGDLREDLLQEESEIKLYRNLQKVEKDFNQAVAGGNYLAAFEIFYSLLPLLNQFFDQVLVMCEEKDLRENRLNLMKKVVNLWKDLADLSQVVIEGE